MTLLPLQAQRLPAATEPGYARWPACCAQTSIFVADGSLWWRPPNGPAARLTPRESAARHPQVSPCGRWVVYGASSGGAVELRLLTLASGDSRQLTWDGLQARPCGWHPDGRVLYASQRGVPLSRWRLFLLHAETGEVEPIPLADASDGCFIDAQRLVFVRGGLHDDHVHGYRGGAMRALWTINLGADSEARPLWPEADAHGECAMPRSDGERLYFLSDAGGNQSLWSCRFDGQDSRQEVTPGDTPVQSFSVQPGRCVWTAGGQLFDAAAGALDLQLQGECVGLADQWLEEPMRYFETAVAESHGQRALLRCRGRLWLAEPGLQQPSELRLPGGRAGACAFAPDGQSVFAVCDASGEPEIWRLPLDGTAPRQLTHDGHSARTGVWPSPCGRWLAHADGVHQLWLTELSGAVAQRRLPLSAGAGPVTELVWLPEPASLVLCRAIGGEERPQLERWTLASAPGDVDQVERLGDPRFPCHSPCLSADGRWLFYLCEREFSAPRADPWGDRSFGVAFERRVRCDALALKDDAPWPWDDPDAVSRPQRGVPAGSLRSTPLPPGNHRRLFATPERLLSWVIEPGSEPWAGALWSLPFKPDAKPEVDGRSYAFVLHQRGQAQSLVRLAGPNATLQWRPAGTPDVALRPLLAEHWPLRVQPALEWAQHFVDAWRHVREQMYDRQLHGRDWTRIGLHHAGLLRRVSERSEVDEVIGQMLAELGTLHTFVRPAAPTKPAADVPGFLGLRVKRVAEGLRVEQVLAHDPAQPEQTVPAAAPGTALRPGDLILSAGGQPANHVGSLGQLLAGRTGSRVALDVLDAQGRPWRVPALPVRAAAEQDLLQADWLQSQRERVRQRSQDRIGYVHLRAMRRADLECFARDAYAGPHWQGLVLDVRGNRGGNIDSWLIEKLRRQAWCWWNRREGPPVPNMPGALSGHLAVLIDAQTYSDGETFASAVRHFGLGPLVGQRSSGAGVWLTQQPNLLDGGTVTVGQFGQFDAQGRWLIEGHGVEPDVVVDNLPHASFSGSDAQLDAALQLLLARIDAQPFAPPTQPPAPRAAPNLTELLER